MRPEKVDQSQVQQAVRRVVSEALEGLHGRGMERQGRGRTQVIPAVVCREHGRKARVDTGRPEERVGQLLKGRPSSAVRWGVGWLSWAVRHV